jgi:hypothetical protein
VRTKKVKARTNDTRTQHRDFLHQTVVVDVFMKMLLVIRPLVPALYGILVSRSAMNRRALASSPGYA